MKTPIPIARAQQVIGMPEHPCETIVRNGALICPYEEMEVQFYPEHSGLYLLTLLGKPFEIFGMGEERARASLLDGHLPVVSHVTEQQGCQFEQTAFACLLEGDTVRDGTEKLVNMVRLRVTNLSQIATAHMPVTLAFGSCFNTDIQYATKPNQTYWKEFLLREDVAEEVSLEREIARYPYPVRQEGSQLLVDDKGILFQYRGESVAPGAFIERFSDGTWAEGREFSNGWRIELVLNPGETKVLDYIVPYLPLEDDPENRARLGKLDFDGKLAEIKILWNSLLARGTNLSVPGTSLGDLWKAQTAATFILVDKQNKGSGELFGREMYQQWAKNYPDKVLSYVHLSPSLYEFVWAQEAAYWVVGMLDLQGYHKEAEEYLETFFALQGVGVPGVHDRSILPDTSIARSFMGTTPHSWLNSDGGVLMAMSRHFKLTNDREWMSRHRSDIASACRWIIELRKTTKNDRFPGGYGLMPPGQSTDATFASDHLQWYYTDFWSLRGLHEMATVFQTCGFEEGSLFREEAEDYRICLLQSLDRTILDVADFHETESGYDYSSLLYGEGMRCTQITDRDENGMPRCFKDKVFLKAEAEALGLQMYLPMSPNVRMPFKEPYLDGGYFYAFGLLSGIMDFNSAEPICEGASHSGREIWDALHRQAQLLERFDLSSGLYSADLPYNDFLIRKFLEHDECRAVFEAFSYVLRYGCETETHMGKEVAGGYQQEMWFQPCPFTLSMATLRSWIRMMFVYEDEPASRLVIGKALPKEWMENAATWESPLQLTQAASGFGPVSVSYRINFTCRQMDIAVELHDVTRLPSELEVRFNHPQDLPASKVLLNGNPVTDFNDRCVRFHPAVITPAGTITITTRFG